MRGSSAIATILCLPGHRFGPGLNVADFPVRKPGVGEEAGNGGLVVGAEDESEANAHVEDALHFRIFDAAKFLQPGEDRRNGPRPLLKNGLCIFREDAFEIVTEATAGDVRDAVDDVFDFVMVENAADGARVNTGGLEEGFADSPAELGDLIVNPEASQIKDNFADQAIAVAVQAAGSDTEDNIAGRDRGTVDQMFAANHTDAKPGEIVFAAGVNVRHDCRFAAKQSAIGLHAAVTDPFDELLEPLGVVVRHGDVIEKKQRLSPAAEGVVHAHGDEIDADGIVLVAKRGDFELGADPVRAGDEHRVFVLPLEQAAGEIELKQAGKAPIELENPGGEGAVHQPGEARHGLVIRLKIDAGVFVSDFGH